MFCTTKPPKTKQVLKVMELLPRWAYLDTEIAAFTKLPEFHSWHPNGGYYYTVTITYYD